ncbi:MAG TPA: hypothetical protein VJI46_05420 [Candidatus Nanoarchaeia archaeon]|nr:hypothetical protein [Candidatus Nanoarchaeia archaeon]
MKSIDLSLVDPQGLVEKLGRNARLSGETLERGYFRELSRFSFLSFLKGREAEKQGVHTLYTKPKNGNAPLMYKGILFVERGIVVEDYDTGFGPYYETLELHVDTQLEMHKGILRSCFVSVTVVDGEGAIEGPRRVDREYVLGILPVPAKLEELVPTDFFLKEGIYVPKQYAHTLRA